MAHLLICSAKAQSTIAGEIEAEIPVILHELVNQIRIDSGVQVLKWNSELAEIAVTHGRDMARMGYFGHVNQNGETPNDRARNHDFDLGRKITVDNRVIGIGENLFSMEINEITQNLDELAKIIVDSWFESPDHRKNLLNPNFSDEGLGVVVTDNGATVKILVTQNLF